MIGPSLPAGAGARVSLGLNFLLLVGFPVAWQAPLVSAGLGGGDLFNRLPGWAREMGIFALNEVTILSGVASLWETDPMLAVVVAALALMLPIVKTLALIALLLGLLNARAQPILANLGKWAMADVFLIAVFVVVFKGVNFGRIEVGWGLHLFTACVIAGLVAGILAGGARKDFVKMY